MEKGLSQGVPSYLVDDVGELQLEWFTNVETVVVTAGASAPELVVTECINYLKQHFDASISDAVLRKENVRFPLPRELQTLRNGGTISAAG